MSTCPYCIEGVQDSNEKWIACDACQEWYHWHCLKLTNVDQIENYHCPECVPKHGPTTCKLSKNKKFP